MSRVNLKNGKKAPRLDPIQPVVEEEIPPPRRTVEDNYHDLDDEFAGMKLLGLDEKLETEKVTKYLVDDTDIEGKSYVDRDEKMIFTLVSIMAEYPKFAKFRLDRFPKKWLHYALGEEGRGRLGALDVLKGNVRIGEPRDQGLPGQPQNGRRP